jgi:hypothetical protein
MIPPAMMILVHTGIKPSDTPAAVSTNDVVEVNGDLISILKPI